MYFPNIDPVALDLGFIQIRWYSLAYIFGIIFGFAYFRFAAKKYELLSINKKDFDDLIFTTILGLIIGGRLGYVLFYNFSYYLSHPFAILQIWQGGMSFHGGLIGFTIAVYLHARKREQNFLSYMDLLSCSVPIGLFLGRIANFINGELWGRVSNHSFAIIFPHADLQPRHPSQLYQAALEGLATFIILFFLIRIKSLRVQRGVLTGSFLCCYGISRFIVEFFREPDAQLGLFFNFISMGQILTIPMLIFGLYLIFVKDNFLKKL